MNKENTTNNSPDLKSLFAQFESLTEEYLGKKAPALPDNAKEAIVKYSPYITLVVMLFALPVILGAIGLTAVLTPFAYMGGVRSGMSFSFSTLFLLATLVLEGLALPGLFARKLSGWKLVYYGVLINAVYSLLSLQIGNMIVSTLISLYILVQVKSYYKN
jgi:hypothetical protein